MNLKSRLRFLPQLLPVAAAALLAGCDRGNVEVVTVPKENPATPVAALPPGHPEPGMGMGSAASAANMGMDPAMRPKLSYKTPDGWTEVNPGSVRVASFKISKDGRQADMSVVPLSGAAGGDLANVNRWRGQVGLEPVTAEALKASAEKVEIAGGPGELYDLNGKNPGSGDPMRVLGAIQNRDGIAWFFKLSGDSELVASQKPALIEFMKSVQFQAPDLSALPPSHPPIGDMAMPGTAAPTDPINRDGQPRWAVPSGWQETAGGQFLVAKFLITGEGGSQAAVNVSASAGDGGGLAANVNRWRRQIGLSEVAESEIASTAKVVEASGTKVTFVDISGTDPRSQQPTRVVGAMVPQGGQTFFYKLAGDSKLVGAQKEAFEKFVQTAKY